MGKKMEKRSVKEGLAMIKHGQWMRAIDIAMKVLENQPTAADAMFIAGVAYGAAGHYTNAEEMLKKALKYEPKHFESWYHLGLVYLEYWKYGKAVECFEKVLKHNPENHMALFQLGCALRGENQLTKAINVFQLVILTPLNPDSLSTPSQDYTEEAKKILEDLGYPWKGTETPTPYNDFDQQSTKKLPKKSLNEMLLRAASQNDLEKVKLALKGGADIDALKNDKTALTIVCDHRGSFEIAEYLVKHGANIDHGNEDRDTPLTYASMYGKLDHVKLLLNNGANVNKKGAYGRTPLHYALSGSEWSDDYPEIVELLLKNGADPNIHHDGGDTPLLEAVWNDDFTVDMLKILLKYNVNLDAKNKFYNDTALERASEKGRMEILKLLIDNRALNNKEGKEIEKIIIKAFRNIQKEVVMYLLEETKDKMDKKLYSGPIFSIAAEKDHIDILQWLLDHGLDIKNHLEEANYALCEAAYTNAMNSIKFLIEHGADVNGGNYEAMENPLMKAARHNYKDMAKYLLKKGANIEARDYRGNTPLNFAAWEGKLEMVEFLLQKDANINAKNELNWTPLMQASLEGHSKIVEFLLKNGASVEEIDSEKGASVLILAAHGCSLSCVKLLLEHGADKTIEDKEGKSAAEHAIEQGCPKVAEFIENYK